MWKLKVSEGKDDPWLRSVNNHIGRQYWEFDPNLGTLEEREQVEKIRANFHKNRFEIKHSSDLLMRMQVTTFLFYYYFFQKRYNVIVFVFIFWVYI